MSDKTTKTMRTVSFLGTDAELDQFFSDVEDFLGWNLQLHGAANTWMAEPLFGVSQVEEIVQKKLTK